MPIYDLDWSQYQPYGVQDQQPEQASQPTQEQGQVQETLPTNIQANVSTSPEVEIDPDEIESLGLTGLDDMALNIEVPESAQGLEGLQRVATSAAETLGDIEKGAVSGAIKGYNATLDLGASVGNFMDQMVANTIETGSISEAWNKSEMKDVRSIYDLPEPEFLKPETLPGQLTEGFAQFLSTFIPVAKLKLFGTATTGLGRFAINLGEGGIADFMSMKAQQENLTGTLIEAFPSLRGTIADYMANDGKDDNLSARLRNVLEGGVLGAATEPVIRMIGAGFKSFKAMSGAKSVEEAIERVRKDPEAMRALGIEEPSPVIEKAKKTMTAEDQPSPSKVTEAEVSKTGEAEVSVPVQATPLDEAKTILKGKGDLYIIDNDGIMKLQQLASDDTNVFKYLQENTNFSSYTRSSERGREMLKVISDVIYDNMEKAKPQTFDDLTKEASRTYRETGLDVPSLISQMRAGEASVKQATVASIQIRSFLEGLSKDVYDLASKIRLGMKEGTVSNKDRVDLIIMSRSLQNLFMATEDFSTAVARSLNSRKITADPNALFSKGFLDEKGNVDMTSLFDRTDISKMDDAEMLKFIETNGIDDKKLGAAVDTILFSGGDPEKMFKVMNTLKKNDTIGRQISYVYTNNILSGPITHAFNIVGNALQSYLLPCDALVGAVVGFDGKAAVDALRRIKDQTLAIKDAFSYAASAFRTGVSGLTDEAGANIGSKLIEMPTRQGLAEPSSYTAWKNIFLQNSGKDNLNWMQDAICHVLGFAGTPARLNARIMVAEDEFFRQLTFRGQMRSQITRKLDDAGLEGAERKAAAKRLEDSYFTSDGIVNKENEDAMLAYKSSKESVFAEDVPDTIQAINTLTNKSFFIKMGMPFVRTVYNVMRAGTEYTGLPILGRMIGINSRMAEDIAAGGVRRQTAIGKAVTGLIGGYMLWDMCAEGNIVGELSKDKKIRQMQERAGMKPYSMKIDGKWYQYQRADPLSTVVSIVANTYQTINNSADDMTDRETTELIEGCISSIFSILVDKSFMTGIVDMADAIKGDASKRGVYLTKVGQAFIPASSFLKQTSYLVDPRIKEVPQKPDALMGYNNISAFAQATKLREQSTPVRYDWLTGEVPMHSYFYKDTNGMDSKKKFVINELLNANIAGQISAEPQRKIRGKVDLTPEQYSKLCELEGTMKLNGKTQLEAIYDLMQSPRYDMKRERFSDAPSAKESYRGSLVTQVIQRYRERAEAELLRVYPDIKVKINEAYKIRRSNLRGKSQGQRLLDTINP